MVPEEKDRSLGLMDIVAAALVLASLSLDLLIRDKNKISNLLRSQSGRLNNILKILLLIILPIKIVMIFA